VELPHGHSLVRVDVRVQHARGSLRRCIRPSDRRVGDVNAHHARNPNDRHGELRHDRNQDHGHVGARAS